MRIPSYATNPADWVKIVAIAAVSIYAINRVLIAAGQTQLTI